MLVSSPQDGNVEVWDIDNREMVFSLGITFNRVTPNVFCSQSMALCMTAHRLSVWDIECGTLVTEMDLDVTRGPAASAVSHFAHTSLFERVALLVSDDDFNQTIVVLEPTECIIRLRIAEFDVKDEFFPDSAVFTSDGRLLIFVKARSEVAENDLNIDFVKVGDIIFYTAMQNVVDCSIRWQTRLTRVFHACVSLSLSLSLSLSPSLSLPSLSLSLHVIRAQPSPFLYVFKHYRVACPHHMFTSLQDGVCQGSFQSYHMSKPSDFPLL